jgi:hypothetical protein
MSGCLAALYICAMCNPPFTCTSREEAEGHRKRKRGAHVCAPCVCPKTEVKVCCPNFDCIACAVAENRLEQYLQ